MTRDQYYRLAADLLADFAKYYNPHQPLSKKARYCAEHISKLAEHYDSLEQEEEPPYDFSD
jgi:hypothetical protein